MFDLEAFQVFGHDASVLKVFVAAEHERGDRGLLVDAHDEFFGSASDGCGVVAALGGDDVVEAAFLPGRHSSFAIEAGEVEVVGEQRMAADGLVDVVGVVL